MTQHFWSIENAIVDKVSRTFREYFYCLRLNLGYKFQTAILVYCSKDSSKT